MKFSEQKEKELANKIQNIILACVKKATQEKDSRYIEEWYVMEKVWNEELVKNPKSLFLLGGLVQKIYTVAPKAIEQLMQAMGLIVDESKLSQARKYWVDKYGEKESTILCEKLLIAFQDDKYTLEQIESMGDKIEIMRGNNKIK